MLKALMWLGGVLGALIVASVVYNLDAITGRWKYERLCKTEGGPRFYAPVEKDVGWEVESHDTYAYQAPFRFGHVAFVRYEDKKGDRFDVQAGDYISAGQRKYTFLSVDGSKPVRYSYRYLNQRFPDDERFSRAREEITDLKTGQLVAAYTSFGFRWTKPERVILAAPTGVQCWWGKEGFQQFYQGIHNLGKKQ